MERDDIMRWAREAGVPMEYSFVADATVWDLHPSIERFARLVAAAERKAILELCEDWHFEAEDPLEVAKAIRARGKYEQG